MTRYVFLLWAGSGLAVAACFPVTGNRIVGHDLALADQRFSALPATLTVGFAAVPGAQRVFTPLDLQHLARVNGMPVMEYDGICFEIPMRRLTEEDASIAMRRSLPPEATLKIVETAKFAVPAGVLEFPVEGLEPATPAGHGVQLWRGHVKFAESRQVTWWARVEVTTSYTAIIAARDLPAYTPIVASCLRVETLTGPLERAKLATRIEDVEGRVPNRALTAGSIIPLAVLTSPPTVRRGDRVAVEVRSGLAHVRFQAVAENNARDGDIVELRNPANGKTFKARLGSGPKVLVVIPAEQIL